MALLNVADVAQSVAALLDDPSQSTYDVDYVLPYLNLRFANLIVNFVMLGLQYSEEQSIFDLPAGTTDLSNYMLPGQPLAALMQPKQVWWKPQGADDTQYEMVTQVIELDDVPAGNEGVDEFAWIGGTLLLTPAGVTVTLRVRFQAMSVTLVDPTDGMIRGVGDILAYRTAELIASVRGGMGGLDVKMRMLGDTALDDFCAMSVLRSQTNRMQLQPVHRRRFNVFGASQPTGFINQ